MKSKKVISFILIFIILFAQVEEIKSRAIHARLHHKRVTHKSKTTIKDSPFEIGGAIIIFFLQVVSKLNIPKISDLAKQTIRVKQFSESCYRGISEILGLVYPLKDTETTLEIDTKEVERAIAELKEELKKQSKYYLGNSVNQEIFSDEKKLCKALQEKIRSIPFDESDTKEAFQRVYTEFKQTLSSSTDVNPCTFLVQNDGKNHLYKKASEYFAPSCYISPFSRTGAGRVKSHSLFTSSIVNPLPYYYYGMPGNMQMMGTLLSVHLTSIRNKLNDEKFMEELFKAAITEEKERREKISQCSDNLNDLSLNGGATISFLSIFSNIIKAIKTGKNFYDGCLKPAYDYVHSKLEEREAERKRKQFEAELEEIKQKISGAKSLDEVARAIPNMTPEQVLALKTELENIASYEEEMRKLAEEEQRRKALQEELERKAKEEDERKKREMEEAARAQQLEEDKMYFLNDDGLPLSQAEIRSIKTWNENPEIKETIKKAVKEAVVEEAKSFVESEFKEMVSNPAAYGVKVLKERAIFIACPECYVAKAGAEFALSVGFNLIGKGKDAYMENSEFFQKHKVTAFAVNAVFDYASGKVKDRASGAISQVTGYDKLSENVSLSGDKKKSKNPNLKHRFLKHYRRGVSKAHTFNINEILESHVARKRKETLYLATAAKIKDLRINKRNELLMEIGNTIKEIFLPTITSYICSAVEKALINMLGGIGTVWLVITRGKTLYDITRKVLSGINNSNLIEKWSDYGEAVGMGIGLVTGSDTGFCSRRRRFYRRVARFHQQKKQNKQISLKN